MSLLALFRRTARGRHAAASRRRRTEIVVAGHAPLPSRPTQPPRPSQTPPPRQPVAPVEIRSSVRLGFADGSELDVDEDSAAAGALRDVAATLLSTTDPRLMH